MPYEKSWNFFVVFLCSRVGVFVFEENKRDIHFAATSRWKIQGLLKLRGGLSSAEHSWRKKSTMLSDLCVQRDMIPRVKQQRQIQWWWLCDDDLIKEVQNTPWFDRFFVIFVNDFYGLSLYSLPACPDPKTLVFWVHLPSTTYQTVSFVINSQKKWISQRFNYHRKGRVQKWGLCSCFTSKSISPKDVSQCFEGNHEHLYSW